MSLGLENYYGICFLPGKRLGGAPINFVYHASCLGAEGYAISAVGDDELGKEIVDELDKNHIQHLIEKVPYPTGTVQVELREGIPTYTIHERVAWDHISPTSDAKIDIQQTISVFRGVFVLSECVEGE